MKPATPVGLADGIDQLTGDVTAGPGPGSVAATIAAGAVTNAKMANMANDTVKANISGGAAPPSDVSFSSLVDGVSIVIAAGVFAVATSPVTPGTYTNPTVTVDQYGRVTSISNGSAAAITSLNCGRWSN